GPSGGAAARSGGPRPAEARPPARGCRQGRRALRGDPRRRAGPGPGPGPRPARRHAARGGHRRPRARACQGGGVTPPRLTSAADGPSLNPRRTGALLADRRRRVVIGAAAGLAPRDVADDASSTDRLASVAPRIQRPTVGGRIM